MWIQPFRDLPQKHPNLVAPFIPPSFPEYRSQLSKELLAFLGVFILSIAIGAVSARYCTNHQMQTGVKKFLEATSIGAKIKLLAIEAAFPAVWEEVIFRGFLPTMMKSLQRNLNFDENSDQSRYVRIALNAILFDLPHGYTNRNWQSNLTTILQLFPLSLQLAYVQEKTKNVYSAMSLHFLFNAGNLVLATV